ncbi:MAG: DUF2569 domain-containing protein [Myxococcota bacterium]
MSDANHDQPPSEDGPKGLGGWLLIVGLRVVLSPVGQAVGVFRIAELLRGEGAWEALSVESGSHPLARPLVAFELVASVVMLCASVYIVYLFFAKRPTFPKLFIAILIAELAIVVLDGWLLSLIAQSGAFDADSMKAMARALLSCIAYIPYILVSKRVANTFAAPS